MSDDPRHLAWFLGPKAENSLILEELVTQLLRDYTHWRRNYFPDDPHLLNRRLQRGLEEESDALRQAVTDLAAHLRRSFPFYSPRYLAHQQSEVTMAGMIGMFTGLLYNANNVTTESAPVTVDLEIDACNLILTMLGFKPAPDPGSPHYDRERKETFGWAHLTSGGTAANIEALWVARNVRYLPYAIWDAAHKNNIPVVVRMVSRAGANQMHTIDELDLRTLAFEDLHVIRPNEAIYLLPRFVESVAQHSATSTPSASALQMLRESPYSMNRGMAAGPTGPQESSSSLPQPVVFVAGTAHYSIRKAANIVGIGERNVQLVATTPSFRLDIVDLERKVRQAVREGRLPIAVVTMLGTTEEGAVDPLHEVVALRERLEEESFTSFWLHADAAWGGFIKSVFEVPDEARVAERLRHNIRILGGSIPEDANGHGEGDVTRLADEIDRLATSDVTATTVHGTNAVDNDETPLFALSEEQRADIGQRLSGARQRLEKRDYSGYLNSVKGILAHRGRLIPENIHERRPEGPPVWTLRRSDIHQVVTNLISSSVEFEYSAPNPERGDRTTTYSRTRRLTWGDSDVLSAFTATDRSDSVTLDPHKTYHLPYAAGLVAFKNDRVRHLVRQEAPVITGSKQNLLDHHPPRHLGRDTFGATRIVTDSFGPFVLEGSRPSGAATALWLSTKLMPLTYDGHGQTMRASLLAARELYQWLATWSHIRDALGLSHDYEILLLSDRAPDTHVVNWVVKPRNITRLREMNALTVEVYRRFSILAELGDRQFSYSQPFFLSFTMCEEPVYPAASLASFFARAKLRAPARDYASAGLAVLRATVASPYILPLRERGLQNVFREFMTELDVAAQRGVKTL